MHENSNGTVSKLFEQVSRTLADRYEVIFYVDVKTNEYMICSSSDEFSDLGTANQGSDFFKDLIRDVNNLIHPEDRKMVIEALDKKSLLETLDKNGSVSLSYRQVLEGRQQYVELMIMYAHDDHDHLVFGVANSDAQIRHQKTIEAENRNFSDIATALASKYEVIYKINSETGEYTEYSTSSDFAWSNSGNKGTDFFGDTQKNLKDSVYSEDYPMVAENMKKENFIRTLKAFGKLTLNYRLMIGGTPSYVSLYAVSNDEEAKNIIIAVANIDEAKREMYDITHDMMTGLLTRECLYTSINERLKTDTVTPYYILYFDVKNFQVVNDIFGTNFGNQSMRYIADWIRKTFSEKCLSGRLIGASFGVLIPKDEWDPAKIEDGLSKFMIKNNNLEYHVLIHTGVYEIDRTEGDVSVMFDRALLSLSTISDEFHVHIAYYDTRIREHLMWEQEISSQLNEAIETMQLCPYLQPIADINGKIVGAEALARWEHPKYGFLPPYKFIPVFEHNGMIVDVDKHMWRCACEILSRWKKCGSDMFISVNISPKDFYFTDVLAEMKKLVAEYDIEPAKLRVEITETVMMNDAENKMGILDKFRCAGFIVEMDDFGSGYSSLNMLKDMPVDVLKIDMKFLGKSSNAERARIIVHNVISLTKELGIVALTEGVETQPQHEILTDMGCTLFQGYYFAKPMPVKEFEEFAALKTSEINNYK
ncbi:MAG: EAL domain-containing protein [Oscillospiraceae bacterium]|nr:EAL domain-containing protein [Oscillospiraceae bacterium]